MALQEDLARHGNFLFRYRSYLPLIILVAGVGAFFYSEWQRELPDSSVYYQYRPFLALAICFLGLAIRSFAVGFAGRNTSGRNTSVGQVADSLNTSGIYSIVRHPLYVGNFFMWFGIAFFVEQVWFLVSFTLFFWIYYERIAYAEEHFLREKFGQPYRDWADGISAFIPNFSKWKSAGTSFRWKMVLKNEKNGVMIVFILIYLFQLMEVCIHHREFRFIMGTWFYAAIGGVVYYALVKFLQKKTKVLTED